MPENEKDDKEIQIRNLDTYPRNHARTEKNATKQSKEYLFSLGFLCPVKKFPVNSPKLLFEH
jgi:hypothetical protein